MNTEKVKKSRIKGEYNMYGKRTIVKKISRSVIMLGVGICIGTSILAGIFTWKIFCFQMKNELEQMAEISVFYVNKQLDNYEKNNLLITQEGYLKEKLKEYAIHHNDQTKAEIEELLTWYYSTFRDISAISVIIEGQVINNIGSEISEQEILSSEWYRVYKENRPTRMFSSEVGYSEKTDKENGDRIFLAYPHDESGLETDIVFQIPLSQFVKGMQVDKVNCVQYRLLNQREKNLKRNGYNDIGTMDLVVEEKTRIGQWTLIMYIPFEQILMRVSPIIGMVVASVTASIIIVWKVLLGRIRKYLNPITEFQNQIKKISSGSNYHCINIKTGDELEELADNFNAMMERLNRSVDERLVAENEKHKLEYALIHSQIDPHFIYKVLNVIIYLNQMGRRKELTVATRSLIEILHDKLRINQVNIFDTLKNEMDIIQSYLEVWNIYYAQCICLEIDISKELLEEEVPKNIVQPFIENAVFHGLLLKDDEDGNLSEVKVKVHITEYEGKLLIIIEDNGYGMTEEQIQKYFYAPFSKETEKGVHVGIRNVRQRLSWIYGEDYKLRAESEIGVGTRVELCINKRGGK